MNGTLEQAHTGAVRGHLSEQERSARVAWDISWGSAIVEAAAAVLAILGLAGVLPRELVSIAAIAIGVNLFLEGGTLGARCALLLHSGLGSESSPSAAGNCLSSELIAGMGGIILGILSLVWNSTYLVLTSVAVMAYGVALVLGSMEKTRLNQLEILCCGGTSSAMRPSQNRIGLSAFDSQFMMGLGILILGILAVIGINPQTLTLVALLCTGIYVLLNNMLTTNWLRDLSARWAT